MLSLKELLNITQNFLEEKGLPGAPRQAEQLIAGVLGLRRIDLYLDPQRPLTEEEVQRCRHALRRRANREPLPYIQGEVEFFGCSIKVTPAVLIPRQETEILVEKVAQTLSREPLPGKVLWDVCCGSGCIGLALKNRFPELHVVLADISPEALKVARDNGASNGLIVQYFQGDMMHPFQGQKADFIVCNPPYVSPKEFEELEPEVREFEPRDALIAEEEGLAFYRRLSEELPHYLNAGGKGWLEIGYAQGPAVLELFSAPCWKKREVQQDWSGKDRFFLLEME